MQKKQHFFFLIPLNTCNYKTFSSCSYLLCNALLRGANSDLTSSPFACTSHKNNSSSETRLHPGVNTESRAEQSTQDFLNKPFWDQLITSPLLSAHWLRTTFHFSPAEPRAERLQIIWPGDVKDLAVGKFEFWNQFCYYTRAWGCVSVWG